MTKKEVSKSKDEEGEGLGLRRGLNLNSIGSTHLTSNSRATTNNESTDDGAIADAERS